MAKFSKELEALTTPSIRSVLRHLNNTVEKLVKPTELASMKHDKCFKIIEDKYKPADIEKALASLGKKPEPKPTKAAVTKTTNTTNTKTPQEAQTEKAIFEDAFAGLHSTADRLEELVSELRNSMTSEKGASYILDLTAVISDAPCFIIIGASANGAIVIDGPHNSLELAHKNWPEAIPPKPIADADDIKDLL